MLGDGFTQDFLKTFQLNDVVRCSVPNHFGDRGARYLPVANDTLAEQPLWSRDLWPQLTTAWEAFGRDDCGAFYESLRGTPFNPDRKRNVWTFDTSSIAYELRCYLWHLFRYFHFTGHAVLQAPRPRPLSIEWHWGELLQVLLAEFRLNVVSFNYDRFFETAMDILIPNVGGESLVRTLAALDDDDYMDYPANSVLIRKIHGSLHYILRTPFEAFFTGGPNPWKVPMVFENNLVTAVEMQMDHSWELKRFPLIPDMVPPGHPGDDICNPVSYALDRSQEQLSNSQLVVFCGLSGRAPDTEEVRALIQAIRPGSTVIQIGLNADRNGCLSGLLDDAGFRARHFVSAGADLRTIPELLKRAFSLRYSW